MARLRSPLYLGAALVSVVVSGNNGNGVTVTSVAALSLRGASSDAASKRVASVCDPASERKYLKARLERRIALEKASLNSVDVRSREVGDERLMSLVEGELNKRLQRDQDYLDHLEDLHFEHCSMGASSSSDEMRLERPVAPVMPVAVAPPVAAPVMPIAAPEPVMPVAVPEPAPPVVPVYVPPPPVVQASVVQVQPPPPAPVTKPVPVMVQAPPPPPPAPVTIKPQPVSAPVVPVVRTPPPSVPSHKRARAPGTYSVDLPKPVVPVSKTSVSAVQHKKTFIVFGSDPAPAQSAITAAMTQESPGGGDESTTVKLLSSEPASMTDDNPPAAPAADAAIADAPSADAAQPQADAAIADAPQTEAASVEQQQAAEATPVEAAPAKASSGGAWDLSKLDKMQKMDDDPDKAILDVLQDSGYKIPAKNGKAKNGAQGLMQKDYGLEDDDDASFAQKRARTEVRPALAQTKSKVAVAQAKKSAVASKGKVIAKKTASKSKLAIKKGAAAAASKKSVAKKAVAKKVVAKKVDKVLKKVDAGVAKLDKMSSNLESLFNDDSDDDGKAKAAKPAAAKSDKKAAAAVAPAKAAAPAKATPPPTPKVLTNMMALEASFDDDSSDVTAPAATKPTAAGAAAAAAEPAVALIATSVSTKTTSAAQRVASSESFEAEFDDMLDGPSTPAASAKPAAAADAVEVAPATPAPEVEAAPVAPAAVPAAPVAAAAPVAPAATSAAPVKAAAEESDDDMIADMGLKSELAAPAEATEPAAPVAAEPKKAVAVAAPAARHINEAAALSFLDEGDSTSAAPAAPTPAVKAAAAKKSDDQLLSEMLGDALLQTQATTRRTSTALSTAATASTKTQSSAKKQKTQEIAEINVDDVLNEVDEMASGAGVASFLQVKINTQSQPLELMQTGAKTSMKELSNMYYYHALAAELSKYDEIADNRMAQKLLHSLQTGQYDNKFVLKSLFEKLKKQQKLKRQTEHDIKSDVLSLVISVCADLDNDFESDVGFFSYPAPAFATKAISEDDSRGVQKMQDLLATIESTTKHSDDDTSKTGLLKRAIEKVLGITV